MINHVRAFIRPIVCKQKPGKGVGANMAPEFILGGLKYKSFQANFRTEQEEGTSVY